MDVPDIAQYFPHLQERVLPHSMGQPVLSDWGDKPDDEIIPDTNLPWKHFKQCGFLNRDEAAILYACAKQIGGYWLDIGAHTGWTTLHMAAGDCEVDAVEPMFTNQTFVERFQENVRRSGETKHVHLFAKLSRDFFDVHAEKGNWKYDGVMIDGEHSWEHPLRDAVHAYKRLWVSDRAVVLLHDFIGGPVREAVKYLKAEGMKCRVYPSSSQWLAVCWHGDFTPPDYTPDPSIDWERMKYDMWAVKGRGDFYFEDCV